MREYVLKQTSRGRGKRKRIFVRGEGFLYGFWAEGESAGGESARLLWGSHVLLIWPVCAWESVGWWGVVLDTAKILFTATMAEELVTAFLLPDSKNIIGSALIQGVALVLSWLGRRKKWVLFVVDSCYEACDRSFVDPPLNNNNIKALK